MAGFRYRSTELSLLVLPTLFLALGLLLLRLVGIGGTGGAAVRDAAVVVALLAGVHLVLARRCPGADQLLLPVAAMLTAIGLVMVDRLAPEAGARQAVWIALGLLLVAVTALLPGSISILQSYKYSSAFLGLFLVATTFLLGQDLNGSGARLWLGFHGQYFQPSEMLKVLLVVFLAGYLEDKRELLAWSSSRLGSLKLPPLPYLGPLVVMWGLSLLLLVAQRDLGATLLFFGVFLAMLYMASARAVYAWGGLAAFLGGAFLCFFVFPIVRLRLDVWLDPWSRAHDQGYQVIQALVALASGGVLGSGLGYGYPGYIPAVHTDFVIAAIGEEMGLAGSLVVVALYILLIHRGFRIALDARRSFSTLLAAGLTSVLGIQAAIILAGTLKLIPLTGITLPFISYGGSSIVTNFLIVGLLLRISAEEAESRAS